MAEATTKTTTDSNEKQTAKKIVAESHNDSNQKDIKKATKTTTESKKKQPVKKSTTNKKAESKSSVAKKNTKKTTQTKKTTTKKVAPKENNDSTDELFTYYDSLENAIDIVDEDSDFSKLFYKHFMAGDRTVYQKDITESKVFDEEWIRTLESYLPSIDKIINTPRSNIKYLEEITIIEKAKKINASSVRHLASHTQFISNISPEGDVIPKKILTSYAEPDYAIYENRFVKTLIDRLHIFVANRLKLIQENANSYNKNHVNLKSDFDFNETDVSVNIDVVVKKNVNNQDEKHNLGLLKRVEFLNKMILSYRNSPFYKELAKAPKVNPPIMKTNIIMKNTDFHNCYMLWLFLDRYTILGYDLNVKQRNRRLTKKVEDGYNHLAMLSYLAAEANNSKRRDKYNKDNDEDLYKTTTKKSQKNEDDVVGRPEPISVEDDTINEYYFTEYKKLFKKSVKEYSDTASSKDVALRQAIRQFNNIANAVFQSYFEIEESEDDVFTKLIKEPDPQKEYDDAKEKAVIAKIIREVKEVDYNNSIKLEKRVAKTMAKSSNKLIRKLEADSAKVAEDDVKASLNEEIEKYKLSKQQAKDKIITLDGKKVKVNNAKIKCNKQIKAINDKLKVKEKEIKKQEKAKSSERIKKIRAEHTKRVNDIIAKENALHAKELEKVKKTIAKEKENAALKIKKQRLAEQNAAKKKEEQLRNELLAKEKQIQSEIQKKNKEKLKALRDENEKLIQNELEKNNVYIDKTNLEKGK